MKIFLFISVFSLIVLFFVMEQNNKTAVAFGQQSRYGRTGFVCRSEQRISLSFKVMPSAK